MNNYLFFRTDRIGDFLVSAILLNSIKRNDEKSHITIVCSKKNFFYVNSLKFVDEVYLYPEKFIEKIFFFLKLNKRNYNLIGALDGKKRSIYFSIFLKSKIKVLMTTKFLFKKIFKFFFSNIFYFKEIKSKQDEILKVLNLLDMTFIEEDMFFLKKHNILSKKIKEISNYLIFHFDEKWIFETYIKKYKSIEPNLDDFKLFIKKILENTKHNLVITTGQKENHIIREFKRNLIKINENLYEKDLNNKVIQLYTNQDFFDLKYLIKNCEYLITCHGATTHLANAFNKKIFDIFDVSQETFYKKWNSHIKDYTFFYREDFKILNVKILSKI